MECPTLTVTSIILLRDSAGLEPEELEIANVFREPVLATHDKAIAHPNLVAVTVFTRPAQGQVSQKTSLDWGGACKAPPLAEERLAVDGR